MPTKRKLTMRELRQMLRLAYGGVSAREIGRVLGIARSTVQENLGRAAQAGLTWPLPAELTDDALAGRLFARSGAKSGQRRRVEPNWSELIVELKKPGVTMAILWEEYRTIHPQGYGYSRFCDLLRGFQRRLSPTMRQEHVAGDKVFVDYSGKKLGIGSHVRMFRFFDGVPRLIVPDNLKAGVNKASFYDPELNRSYGMMASHYGVGVLPARPRKPRDKAKVENGVRFAQSAILGRLRNQTFFSLAEANAAIRGAVDRINDHVIRRLGVTRRHLFETVERPALAALPEDYEFAEWRLARAGVDYHVEYDGYFYSVPHGLIREQVDLRATSRTIEVFHRGQRVAAHQRRYGGRRHGTNPDHMPSSHRRYADWSPERLRRWAATVGPSTEGLVIAILANRPHPEHGFRTCLGVLRLFRDLRPSQAEAVSARALEIGAFAYRAVAAIAVRQAAAAARTTTEPAAIIEHSNLRGPGYFH